MANVWRTHLLPTWGRVQHLPLPPLGVEHAYLTFRISAATTAPCTTPILPRVRVHFDHALDHVYVSHLTHGLASLQEETDLSRASDALTLVIMMPPHGPSPRPAPLGVSQ